MIVIKYGVIFYPQTDNLGDHIQTYAAVRQLPHVDYVIDRENMDLFQSENHEPVAVLMNGWYMHNKANFIPGNDIYPLCLSMHFSKYDYFDIGYDFLDEEGGKWLKKFEPIGCRDEASVLACESRGIQAFFSGCMTLTLPQPEKTEDRGSYICAVDLDQNAEAALRALVGEVPVISVTHTMADQKELKFQDAMNMVEHYLKLYGNAKCVLTTRLHCALPCLAMDVPVILVNDAKKDDPLRFSSFLSLLHTISPQDLSSGKLPFDLLNPPSNSEQYLSIRKNLISRMSHIIQNGIEITAQEDADHAEDGQRKLLWQRKLTNQMIHTASQKIVFLSKKNAEMEDWIKELKTSNSELTQRNDELMAWALDSKKEIESLIKKNQELSKWAKPLEKRIEEYSQKNQELTDWAMNSKKEMEELMKKNQELFEWAKSLEKRLE